jgi:zinc-ribbon domain
MKRCSQCGTANNDGATFCSSCGSFLAWGDTPSEGDGTGDVGTIVPGAIEPDAVPTPVVEQPRLAEPPEPEAEPPVVAAPADVPVAAEPAPEPPPPPPAAVETAPVAAPPPEAPVPAPPSAAPIPSPPPEPPAPAPSPADLVEPEPAPPAPSAPEVAAPAPMPEAPAPAAPAPPPPITEPIPAPAAAPAQPVHEPVPGAAAASDGGGATSTAPDLLRAPEAGPSGDQPAPPAPAPSAAPLVIDTGADRAAPAAAGATGPLAIDTGAQPTATAAPPAAAPPHPRPDDAPTGNGNGAAPRIAAPVVPLSVQPVEPPVSAPRRSAGAAAPAALPLPAPTRAPAVPTPDEIGGPAAIEPARHRVHTSYDVAPGMQDASPTVVATRCPACTAANPPDRLLCTRCGTPLRTGEQPVPAGAEGGLFPHTWGEHRVFGSDRSLLKRVIKIVLFGAMALLILAVTIGPWHDPFWNWSRDRLESGRLIGERRPSLVPAQRATATSTRDGLQPRLAIDGFVNTYWAVAQNVGKSDGVGETLTVHFDGPVQIGEIQLATGIQDNITPFKSQPRPKEIQMTFHKGDEHTITQPDESGFHLHKFDAVTTEKVKFQILSVYPADKGGARRNATAIAEIELYSPQ